MRHLLFAAALLACTPLASRATTVALAADGAWQTFDIAPELAADGGLGWVDFADGSALSFEFTVAAGMVAQLSVVDGGFAGDVFGVRINGAASTPTSTVANSYPASIGLDFDAAFAALDYSRGSYLLGAGAYAVTGLLLTSALGDGGIAINSTVGGLKLDVSPVPEASALASLLAGLGLIGGLLRSRRFKTT